jgi:hypothetical protein
MLVVTPMYRTFYRHRIEARRLRYGKVACLMSHVMRFDALDSGNVWSIARGLASAESVYEGAPDGFDMERRNDSGGHGARGEDALANFTKFFLETVWTKCRLWSGLSNRSDSAPASWHGLMKNFAHDNSSRRQTGFLKLCSTGGSYHGGITGLLCVSHRQARRIVSILINAEALRSPSSRAALGLNFPAHLLGGGYQGCLLHRTDGYRKRV